MTVKHTKGKTRVELVPYEAIEAISRAREYGVNKYGTEWEWYDHGNTEDFVSAAIRHLYKWNDARRLDNRTEEDEESGLNHLDHAICSIAMAIALENRSERDKFESAFAIMDTPTEIEPNKTEKDDPYFLEDVVLKENEVLTVKWGDRQCVINTVSQSMKDNKKILEDMDKEWEDRLDKIQSFNNPGISHEEK